MNFILSLIPLLVILYLMVGLRWGAARAGGAGYLSALLVAVVFFGAGPNVLATAHAKAFILSLDVLLIIWAAFLLYRVADEAGAIRTIGQYLPHLTGDRGMQAIIIGWVFASFLQGVGGFGVPVAVIAPILGGLGFAPLAAVVIPSIGHGWAVTFGSLGSSFQALVSATNLPEAQLAPAAALFLGIAGLFTGPMIVHVVGGWAAVRRLLLPCLLVGVGMAVAQYLVAVAGPWNIASFSGGIMGLLIVIPLARRYQQENGDRQILDRKALALALSGYAILIVITLGAQFIPFIKEFLGRVVFQMQFAEVSTSLGYITPAGASRKIVIFRHAGMLLAFSSLLAYLTYRKAGLYTPGAAGRILKGTLDRVLSSSVSIVSMVTMAVVMEHAGMTDSLARGLAEGMGAVFPITAPWIGALGAFMTGSNTNSNVMFGALQLRTAELLNFPAAIILAGQTAGAALASIMAPTKVVVGASTAGMAGKEGEVMRKLLVYTGSLVLLISLLTLAGVWLIH
jgi:lactate permease